MLPWPLVCINMWLDQEASLELGHTREQRDYLSWIWGLGELKVNGARPRQMSLFLVGWRAVISPGPHARPPSPCLLCALNWMHTLTQATMGVSVAGEKLGEPANHSDNREEGASHSRG